MIISLRHLDFSVFLCELAFIILVKMPRNLDSSHKVELYYTILLRRFRQFFNKVYFLILILLGYFFGSTN